MHAQFTLKRPIAENSTTDPEDILAAKTALLNLGLYELPDWGLSGVPDRALFEAIRSFQKSNGLQVDGVMKPGGESEVALKAMAQTVRSHGRNGDTILAHITPAEAVFLDQVTDGGSINPNTGLPEFWGGIGADGDDFGWGPDDTGTNGDTGPTSSNGSGSDDDDDDGGNDDGDDFGWGAGADGGYDSWTGNSAGGNSPGDMGFMGHGDDDNPTRQQYEQRLNSLKGVERFMYGMRHGWKNWNSSRYNQPGVFDYELGRTLTARDFAPGGARAENTPTGRMATQRAMQQRAFAAELKQKSAKHAQAQNTKEAPFQLGLKKAPAKSAKTSSPKKVPKALASGIPKISTSPNMTSLAKANPTMAEQMTTLQELGNVKAEQAAIAAAKAQQNTTSSGNYKVEMANKFGQVFAKMHENQAKIDAQAAVERSSLEDLSALADLERSLGFTLEDIQQSPTPSIGDLAAAEHHPGYGYTNHGRDLLSVMKTGIQSGFDLKNGFTERALDLAVQYAELPDTSNRSARSDLLDQDTDRWSTPERSTPRVSEGWHPPMALNSKPLTYDLLNPNSSVPEAIQEEMKEVQHELHFERSSRISQLKGKYNDGLVGAGKKNFSGISWKAEPDKTTMLKAGNLPGSVSFRVDGPVRIEPVSNTVGYESAVISISWSKLNEDGKAETEFRNPEVDTYNVGGGNFFGMPSGPGYLDFSPPFPNINPYGYEVHISTPPQTVTHGNPDGVQVKVFTQQGDNSAIEVR